MKTSELKVKTSELNGALNKNKTENFVLIPQAEATKHCKIKFMIKGQKIFQYSFSTFKLTFIHEILFFDSI